LRRTLLATVRVRFFGRSDLGMLGHLVSNAPFHGDLGGAPSGAPNLLQRLWALLFRRTR
jgi:hypothetical protein